MVNHKMTKTTTTDDHLSSYVNLKREPSLMSALSNIMDLPSGWSELESFEWIYHIDLLVSPDNSDNFIYGNPLENLVKNSF